MQSSEWNDERLEFYPTIPITTRIEDIRQKREESREKGTMQIVDWKCLRQIKTDEMTMSERKKVQVALMYLTQKHSGVYKGRIGNGTRLQRQLETIHLMKGKEKSSNQNVGRNSIQ